MIRVVRTLSLALAGLAGLTAGASALPLTPEDCDRVKTEQTALETQGVTSDMARGPDWARANLAPDRIERVARWIELQEQILFRCPRPKPVKQPATAVDAPAGKDATKPKSAAKPKPKPKPAAETGDAGETTPKSSKPKTQAPKKPKVEDAYKPPAPFSGQELQHATPGVSVPAKGGTSLAP